jgi:Brix domain
LEFFAEKQDASLFVVGSHSKKRPNNLTFARMFDHKLLDMVEVAVSNYHSCKEFKVRNFQKDFVPNQIESRGNSWITTFNDVLWSII